VQLTRGFHFLFHIISSLAPNNLLCHQHQQDPSDLPTAFRHDYYIPSSSSPASITASQFTAMKGYRYGLMDVHDGKEDPWKHQRTEDNTGFYLVAGAMAVTVAPVFGGIYYWLFGR
jgi:hypothetical protein